MKRLNEIMQEIILITGKIESEYPELYKYLDETPFRICATEKREICKEDLEEYLQTLKEQLNEHIKTHGED